MKNLYKNVNGSITIGDVSLSADEIDFEYYLNDTKVIIRRQGESFPYYDGLITGLQNKSAVAYANRAAIEASDLYSETVIGPLTNAQLIAAIATLATAANQLTDAQLTAALAAKDVGVCNGCVAVTPNDGADLAHPGFIEPRTAAGNIKVTDVNGNTTTLAMDQKETTKFRVKRVFATDTIATGIVVYY